jgi:hypothetical protein
MIRFLNSPTATKWVVAKYLLLAGLKGYKHPNHLSHSGLFDPRGTITVRYDPGDLDR